MLVRWSELHVLVQTVKYQYVLPCKVIKIFMGPNQYIDRPTSDISLLSEYISSVLSGLGFNGKQRRKKMLGVICDY